uniref:Uncharacterized protein n=1 Tax=Globisporangium ultimum (strain ATCC 200006 / CBS 805.95 / DAOM BR144) TaxID=431595 RepID=K3W5P8_GLOUD
MKIAELLNVASASHDGDRQDAPQKQMNMKSLDLFTQQRRRQTLPRVQDLSMNRIIQELRSKDAAPQPAPQPHTMQQQTQRPTAPRQAAAATQEQDEEEPQGSGSAAKKPKRRTRNGFAPLTESEKRVKQRQLVKRSYYRKIDTIKELRDVADKLEEEYQVVLDGRRKFALQHQLHDDASLSFEALREQYTQLAISKDDLRQENEMLRALAAEQSKARTRVGILLDEELRDQEQVAKIAGLPSRPPVPMATDHSVTNEESAAPVLRIKPVTEDECMAVVRDAYTRIMAFRETQTYVTTGASVFGWRDRRKVDGDTMKFFLEKTFPSSAEQVSTTMWDILSTEAGVNRIYNSEINIRFHLVQCVNDSNVIFYRTIERDGQDVTIKSLLLASRVQIDTGYMVLFNSIDPTDRILTPSPQDHKNAVQSSFTRQRREIWADIFSWGLYEHAGENGALCRNSFGGFVPSSSATTLEFWLMHILLIAVRCENEAIGPVFMLQ